jgi:hypothetical protein
MCRVASSEGGFGREPMNRAVGAHDLFVPMSWAVGPGWYGSGLWPRTHAQTGFLGAFGRKLTAVLQSPSSAQDCSHIRAPPARIHTSLGQRPRSAIATTPRAESPTHPYAAMSSHPTRGIVPRDEPRRWRSRLGVTWIPGPLAQAGMDRAFGPELAPRLVFFTPLALLSPPCRNR